MSDITVTVNGTPRVLPAGTPVAELLRDTGLPPNSILVELNEAVLPRSEIPTAVLRDGDRVEFIRVVAGG